MSASTSLPAPEEPTGPPSLSTLPPELKSIIVDMVDQVDEEEEDMEGAYEDLDEEVVGEDGKPIAEEEEHVHGPGCGDHDHDHGSHAHAHEHSAGGGCCGDVAEPSSMSNLSLVSTEFAALAQPYLWKGVDFTERPTDQILYFIQEIVPRHGQHVVALTFSQNEQLEYPGPSIDRDDEEPYDEEEEDEPRMEPSPFLPDGETVTKAEELGNVIGKTAEGIDLPQRFRQARARSLLFASLINTLPNLDTLDFDLLEHQNLLAAAEGSPLPPLEDLVLYAARAKGDKLTDLTLSSSTAEDWTEGSIAEVLSSFPNLLRLDLGLEMSHEGRSDLIARLASLTKLETLAIVNGLFVTDDFAAANWTAPLKILALAGCEDLSFGSFLDFIRKFRDTLTVLDLDETPHDNTVKDNKKYLGKAIDLPHLDTLVLSTLHPASFLQSFLDCRIVEFSFGFCPNITYTDLEAFITAHATTLKQVTIEESANLTAAQVDMLEVFGHAKGINVSVQEPDVDSEFDEENEWLSEDDEEFDEEFDGSDEE